MRALRAVARGTACAAGAGVCVCAGATVANAAAVPAAAAFGNCGASVRRRLPKRTHGHAHATEAAFIVAAVRYAHSGRQLSPSAATAASPSSSIALAGAYGQWRRGFNRQGRSPGKPELGYQLALTPARVFPRRRRGGE